MQLNQTDGKDNSVQLKLSAAVFSVLSAAQGYAVADPTDVVDSALMHYQERDGRVATTEVVVHARETLSDDSTSGISLTFDTLSGGSPNGALPSKTVQTFARPSGHSLSSSANPGVQTYTTASGQIVTSGSGPSVPYTIAPGALPIDSSFHDQRIAANLDWSTPIAPLTTASWGANFSHELDFASLSANATVAHDFNEKNTNLSAGVNLEYDEIRPIGGAPVPMSDYALFKKTGNQNKQVADLLLGISQVMTRRWLTELNLSLDNSNGYQNDPYKIVSALDAAGNTVGYVFENRPRNRSRNSLYWGNKFALDHDTIDLSLRYMTDNWGIKSETAELRYRWALSDKSYFEPQFRYYRQDAANFFRFYLMQGDPLVPYASADPRLAAFDATTLGIRWATQINRSSEFSVRLESYQQTGKGPAVVPPGLQGLNLYPGLKAQLIEVGLKIQF